MGRSASLTPGLSRLRHYQRAWLRGDMLAGITVAAYLVPQVMAYAVVAGLPPVAGLWAVMGSLLVYAVLGSSQQLSVGPESTTALMTAAIIGPLAAGQPARYASLCAVIALLVAGLCALAWAARLGFIADLLSRPVLVGYMTGVALIMIAGQLGKITGLTVSGESMADELDSFGRQVRHVHWLTAVFALTLLAFLLIVTWLAPRAPAPLIGMLVAAGVVWCFGLTQHGLHVIGPIPADLPTPAVPHVSRADLAALLFPAVGLAIVAYNDNALTARAFATRNGYSIDNNQELLALGGANLASGLLRGFPVSSSGSRTVIGDALGSRSQLHSLVALAVVILTLLFLRPVLAGFPIAALGAIVIYAAMRLIDVGEYRRLARFRRSELVLALATTAAVLGFGLLYGVLVAVALSVLDLLRRVARPHDGILGYVPGLAGMHDVDDYPSAQTVPGLVVYRYDSPLFFANAEDFQRRALATLDARSEPVEWFLLNTEAIVEVDITAIDALDVVRAELDRRGIVLALARVKQDLRDDLEPAGFIDRVGADRVFPTLPTAVQAYVAWYTERHGEPPGVAPAPSPPPALS